MEAHPDSYKPLMAYCLFPFKPIPMKNFFLFIFFQLCALGMSAQVLPADYVNPFVGTTNFGTCNPGAVCPNGMMSVVPFNVMGSDLNAFDKDARWWSTPYEQTNSFFTGYSHVNLSGVGCPDLGSLLLMPTMADTLCVDYRLYGSTYTDETATPGYYSNRLTKYGILTEVTATPRTGMARFTFPKGKAHILLNLGEGLTNESGATVRRTATNEAEGSKLLGTFCYTATQAVFPIYFVVRVEKQPSASGYWKFQRPKKGVEAQWDPDDNRYKIYTRYGKEMSGDDIGVWFDLDTEEGETVEVRVGVSFVSIANARENLEKEQGYKHFDELRAEAREKWNSDLSRIKVEGGTDEQKRVFYTALYHLLVHPNILQDVNGQYPAMESDKILTAKGNRYTVFSLWDTYRNVHQLLTLVYPERQRDMLSSCLSMYKEHGWLPKWELYGRETYTMEGDPCIPVIVDSWMKGFHDFDVNLAYEAMRKGAVTEGKNNPLRPDNDDYTSLGYVPLREEFDNSVSHALEYYIADHALSRMAEDLGKKEDARIFKERSLGYKHYFSKEYGTLRPLLPDGTFLTPFDPKLGADFEPNPGFHEGSAWNYTFYVPHDIPGLAKLMGGKKAFVEKLQSVFDNNLYDPANEPDIAYPYLFSYFKGEEWRTQKLTRELLAKYFTTQPNGIPGNDDTGTMSGWAIFSMMGFYPNCPGDPTYILTAPVFDKVTIDLQPGFYEQKQLIIEAPGATGSKAAIRRATLGGKELKSCIFNHSDLIKGGTLKIEFE